MTSANKTHTVPPADLNGPGVSHPGRARSPLSRRDLLRTLAVGAGVAPVLAPLGRTFLPNAHAAEGSGIRRIIFFEHPNALPGGNDDETGRTWFITPGATWKDAKLGHVLAPLERHRDHMVVMQNLEPYHGRDITSSHRNANIEMLTGNSEGDNQGRYYGRSQNASIDWHLSQTVGKQLTPKWPMLMTGIQCPGETHTYMENGDWVPNHNMDPYDLYKKLFADLLQPTPGGASAPDPKLLARLARRRSVLDHVANDVISFQKRLGAADRERAEIQLSSIRTLEERLGDGVIMPDAASAAACKKPVLEPQGLDWKFPNSRNVPQLATMMNDIVVAALSCDLTRIVSMQNWGGDNHNSTCNFAPVTSASVPGVPFRGQGWHSLSHLDPHKEYYRVAKVWLSTVLADLVDKLKAIPEGGGTMLDNTLIFVTTDQGFDHGHHSLQLATIGGRNMGVKVGQYLKCGERGAGRGMRLSRLLVSLLTVMGVPAESWGKLDTGKGPLPGFAA